MLGLSHGATETLDTDMRTVALIDDTEDLRDLLRYALERTGDFTVVGEAGDGEAGIAMASACQPDLVLLDVAMPVMDGFAALPVLRSRCPRSSVVMLSGFSSEEMAPRAVSGGALGYIQKGVSVRLLVAQLVSMLDDDGSSPG